MKPAEVINLQLKKFSSSYDEAKDFEEKNLHAFRLRMKRLKAFMALLREGGYYHLKIPRKLSALYACTGAIRNLQLQKKRILHFCAEENRRPDRYIELLTAEEAQWKHRGLQLVSTVPIAEELAKLVSPVPGHIKKGAVKDFLRTEATKLWTLLLSNEISDEDLHRLRKILKNILYNWKYAGAHAGPFLPFCWQHKDQVRLFAETLGAFHDLCVSLELLHAFWERTDEGERKILQQMKKQWEHDKEEQTQSICAMLAAIKNESRQLEESKHPAGSVHPALWLNV